jgi:hypothetical protein
MKTDIFFTKWMTLFFLYAIFFQATAQSQGRQSAPKSCKAVIKYRAAGMDEPLVLKGYIVTIQDSSLYVSGVKMPVDFMDTNLSALQKIDFGDIQKIKIHQKGAFGKSVVAGLVSGLAVGLVLASVVNQAPEPGQVGPPSAGTQLGNSLAGGLLGASLGAGTGVVFGVASGKKFYIHGEWKNFSAMKEYLLSKYQYP